MITAGAVTVHGKKPSSHSFSARQHPRLSESFPPFPLASSSKLTPVYLPSPVHSSHTGRCSGRHSSSSSRTLTDPNPSPTTLGQLIYRFSVLCHIVAVVRDSSLTPRSPPLALRCLPASSLLILDGASPGDAVGCDASALRLGGYRLRLGSKRRWTTCTQSTTATRHRFWRHDTECEAPSAPACCLSNAPRFVAVEPLVQRCFHDVT